MAEARSSWPRIKWITDSKNSRVDAGYTLISLAIRSSKSRSTPDHASTSAAPSKRSPQMLDSALRIFCWSVPSAREIVIKLEMQSSIVSAVTALFHEFSANLGATPPLYAYAVPGAVLRQQQNKCLGNLVGVRGCEADASSRNIKQPALPTSKSAVESNPGIVVVAATAGDFAYSRVRRSAGR